MEDGTKWRQILLKGAKAENGVRMDAVSETRMDENRALMQPDMGSALGWSRRGCGLALRVEGNLQTRPLTVRLFLFDDASFGRLVIGGSDAAKRHFGVLDLTLFDEVEVLFLQGFEAGLHSPIAGRLAGAAAGLLGR